jgi:hypothetical protein
LGFVYTVSFAATVTAAGADTDWLELTPADDKPCKLRGWIIGQSTEVGDTAEEGLRFSLILLPATVTSGNGTATTGRPLNDLAPTAGFAAETNGTTVATTSGTALTLGEFSWNERASPWEFWFPDDDKMCPRVRQASALVFRQQTTLADDMSATATFFIEEE